MLNKKISFAALFFLLMVYHRCEAENTLNFLNGCRQGTSITIAAAGDILLHTPLQIKGIKKGFQSLWEEAVFYFQHADIAYANLEGPMAYQINEYGSIVHKESNLLGTVYTGYPLFNYPDILGKALKESGIDIVSTANNHALDRASIGVDRTLQALENANVASVGTRRKNALSSWVTMKTVKGIKVAFIACTEHTNGIEDNYHQVLHCYGKKDKPYILNTIQQLKNETDAIIVLPHWGEEYETSPNQRQIHFAHQVLEAGALAVIGSHPHVLQPLQKYMTTDGRETLIMYSLGNFISYQASPKKRTAIILLLGLTKTTQGTLINGVSFVPIYTYNRHGWKNIHLKKLPPDDHSEYSQIISNILPPGNALYSHSMTIHSYCNKYQ